MSVLFGTVEDLRAFSLFGATVPSAAKDIAKSLDAQIVKRFAKRGPKDEEQRHALTRGNLKIMGTTPVNLDNLEQSCAAARQMTEEVSSCLMDIGYRYQEIRKGRFIRFDRQTGELLLTRDVKELQTCRGCGQAILAGTDVVSGKHVRFSMSLIHTETNETLAKASASVPITDDLMVLLDEEPVDVPSMRGRRGGRSSSVPNTYTKLR